MHTTGVDTVVNFKASTVSFNNCCHPARPVALSSLDDGEANSRYRTPYTHVSACTDKRQKLVFSDGAGGQTRDDYM